LQNDNAIFGISMQFYVGYDVSASIIRRLEDLHFSDLLVILPHFYYEQTQKMPVSLARGCLLSYRLV